jgi:hypothetical protein
MIRSTRVRLGLAVGLAALALGANAQPAGNAATANAPAAQSSAQPKASTKAATGKHAGSVHRMARKHAARERMHEASEGTTSADSAYKAALRRCVTGPESARDSCLDQAISQYGHA